METSKALDMAKNMEMDLIEIAPEGKPPVVKIYNYDKFRYDQEKEEKKRKKHQKSKEMKHVRISPRSAKNDLEVKLRRLVKFLEAGHRVELSLFLKGREKANKDFALQKMNDFIEMIPVEIEPFKKPKYSGRGFTTQIKAVN